MFCGQICGQIPKKKQMLPRQDMEVTGLLKDVSEHEGVSLIYGQIYGQIYEESLDLSGERGSFADSGNLRNLWANNYK